MTGTQGPGAKGCVQPWLAPGEQARVPSRIYWPPDQGPAELSEVLNLPTLGLSLVLLREVWETGLSFRAFLSQVTLDTWLPLIGSDELILGVAAG